MSEREYQKLIVGKTVIDLEVPCPRCVGQGHVLVDAGKTIMPCAACRGSGAALTKNGHAILMMLKTYGKLYQAV